MKPKTKQDTEDFRRSKLKEVADAYGLTVIPSKRAFALVKAKALRLQAEKVGTINQATKKLEYVTVQKPKIGKILGR